METWGLLPYKNIAMAHSPQLVIVLGIFYKLFGTGLFQLKLFTWILALVCDLLLYFVVSKLVGRKAAIISVLSYVLLQLIFDGNGLWFDLALVPFAVCLYYFIQRKKYLLSGTLWALMFATKQTAFWFLIPVGLALIDYSNPFLLKKKKIADIFKFAFGVLIVFSIYGIAFIAFGIQNDFIDWAIKFGIFVLPRAVGQIQLPSISNLIVTGFPFAIFSVLLFLNKQKSKYFHLIFWAIAGAMGVYPRFEYFHLQPALPYIAIMFGLFLSDFKKYSGFLKFSGVVFVCGITLMFVNFFMRSWREGTRFNESDVVQVANYVKEKTKPGDKIFVLNWWDNIYPLSGTVPATNLWVPQLSWYQDINGIQSREVSEIKKNNPKMIIFQDYSQFGLSSYIPQDLYSYIIQNYEYKDKIGSIKILIPR
ncbi:MAG: glycosyltransferase family 39 protein [Bacteroidales bacterium]|nr:glycosyltransferase family 39 protein [Bacteroidales bacterium]